MAHMDGNLAAVTLPGELNELAADTLYAFIDEDELTRNSYDLHYYRLDGILIGSVEPIDGIEEEQRDLPAGLLFLVRCHPVQDLLVSGHELRTVQAEAVKRAALDQTLHQPLVDLLDVNTL